MELPLTVPLACLPILVECQGGLRVRAWESGYPWGRWALVRSEANLQGSTSLVCPTQKAWSAEGLAESVDFRQDTR